MPSGKLSTFVLFKSSIFSLDSSSIQSGMVCTLFEAILKVYIFLNGRISEGKEVNLFLDKLRKFI